MRMFKGIMATGEYTIETESGMWDQNHTSQMIDRKEISWHQQDQHTYEYLVHKVHQITTFSLPQSVAEVKGPFPKWLNYFLDNYLWTLNDPISWKKYGSYKVVRIPYKWK